MDWWRRQRDMKAEAQAAERRQLIKKLEQRINDHHEALLRDKSIRGVVDRLTIDECS